MVALFSPWNAHPRRGGGKATPVCSSHVPATLRSSCSTSRNVYCLTYASFTGMLLHHWLYWPADHRPFSAWLWVPAWHHCTSPQGVGASCSTTLLTCHCWRSRPKLQLRHSLRSGCLSAFTYFNPTGMLKMTTQPDRVFSCSRRSSMELTKAGHKDQCAHCSLKRTA